MNTCQTCKLEFDPRQSGTWLFCRDCIQEIDTRWIKESISRWESLQQEIEDPTIRQMAKDIKMSYIRELQEL